MELNYYIILCSKKIRKKKIKEKKKLKYQLHLQLKEKKKRDLLLKNCGNNNKKNCINWIKRKKKRRNHKISIWQIL